jgi:hypothetical protein
MNIGNIRSKQELTKAFQTNDELIRIAIANDNNISNARASQKKGLMPTPPIEDMRTADELMQDENYQMDKAKENLQDLGFRFNEAVQIVNELGLGGQQIINTTYPALKKKLLETYNKKLITTQLFLDWFQSYADQINSAKGLTWGDNAGRFDLLTDNIDDLKALIPKQADLEVIYQRVEDAETAVFRNQLLDKTELLERIKEIYDVLPSPADLQQLGVNTAENQRLINELQKALIEMPTRDEVKYIIDTQDLSSKAGLKVLEDAFSGVSDMQLDLLNEIKDIVESSGGVPASASLVSGDPSLGATSIPEQVFDLENPDDPNFFVPPSIFNEPGFTKLQKKGVYEDFIRSGYLNEKEVKLGQSEKKYNAEYPKILQKVLQRNYEQKVIASLKSPQKATAVSGAKATGGITPPELKLGVGINYTPKKNYIKLGRGLKIEEEEPKYKQFGKYAIHWGHLCNNDLLNVKYKSLGNIPSIKPTVISDNFKTFIIDVIETGKINDRIYKHIDNDEKKLFEKIVIGAGLLNQLKLKKVYIDKEMEEIDKFNILKGEYLAGNNNIAMIKELRRFVIQFMNDGRISKNDGSRLLMELSI